NMRTLLAQLFNSVDRPVRWINVAGRVASEPAGLIAGVFRVHRAHPFQGRRLVATVAEVVPSPAWLRTSSRRRFEAPLGYGRCRSDAVPPLAILAGRALVRARKGRGAQWGSKS